MAAAAAAAAASAGCRFAHDRKRSAVVGGEAGEDEGRRSEAEVVLLLPLLGPEAGVGGDTGNGRDWDSGGGGGGDVDTVMENHVGFAVQSAGTAGKLYGDLEGSVVGVTLVHVSWRCATCDRAALTRSHRCWCTHHERNRREQHK